jgi:hypothetical protein
MDREEFINPQLLCWYQKHHIHFTRGRPGLKLEFSFEAWVLFGYFSMRQRART